MKHLSPYILSCTLLLSACASPIEKMTAQQAAQFSTHQFYELPNYRADYQTQLVDIQFGPGISEQSTVNSSLLEYARFLGKKFQSGATLIVDAPNNQFQMIPYYSYVSKNLNARLQLPIVYQRANRTVYADLSAFDGLLTDVNPDGQYSRFNLSQLPIPEDADKQLIGLMQKYTQLHIQGLPAERFSDAPLTKQDHDLNIVRRIQFTTAPTETFKFLPNILKDLSAIVTPKNSDTEHSVEPNPTNTPTTTQNTPSENNVLVNDMQTQWNKLFGADSKENYNIGMDAAGRIVQMDTQSHLSIHSPDSALESVDATSKSSQSTQTTESTDAPPLARLHINTRFTLSNIGNAQIIEPPTERNSVDGIEHIKKGLFGSLLGAGLKDKNDTTWSPFNSDADTESNWDAPATTERPRQSARTKKPKKSHKHKSPKKA